MLSEEEKQAIEYLKKYTKWETYGERNLEKDIITTLNLVDKLQKENENLKSENSRLKVIRYSREYGTENIYLIPKSDLIQIDINKYMIEIEDGKFVDLKQIYQENKELEKENEKLNKLHIQDNKHLDFIMKHSVPIQKVKDKIEEIDEEIKVKREIAKNPMDRVSGRLLTDSIVELEKTKKVLQSLLEKE